GGSAGGAPGRRGVRVRGRAARLGVAVRSRGGGERRRPRLRERAAQRVPPRGRRVVRVRRRDPHADAEGHHLRGRVFGRALLRAALRLLLRRRGIPRRGEVSVGRARRRRARAAAHRRRASAGHPREGSRTRRLGRCGARPDVPVKEKKIVKRPCVLMSVLVSGCAGGAQLSDAREPTPAPPALEATSGAGAVVEPSAVSPATHVRTTGDLLPPMERAVTSFGAATDGKFAYVLGGYSGTPHAYSREGQSRAVLRLPLSGEGGWEEVGDLGVGLQGLSAVSHRGEVCHFGGNRVDNAASEPTVVYSVATAHCLDPGTAVWRELHVLPQRRLC